ncbi:MAG: 3-carboxy-cis,cis-muconate cycloisomerase [Alphaproteobacteria bacterium]|nr:3-carboxy-cis,cis-muconate cycloisomerase [Alphaproteobacteria bacterium]
MSVSPFDSGLLGGLAGDAVVGAWFSTEAELAAMNAFEAALATAEANEGLIPSEAARHIGERLHSFAPDIDAIRVATARDGVVGVDYVRQLRVHVGEQHGRYVHFGATSQDLVDTALVLRLGPILDEFDTRLAGVIAALDALDGKFGARVLMGHTRMQKALPIVVADRIAAWRAPLVRHLQRLAALRPHLLIVQLGGAVGTRDRLGDKGSAVARRLADNLGLGFAETCWHTGRDGMAELAGWCALTGGSLGKIGADIALLAQAGDEIVLEQGGASSAIPNKSNPVAAEMLVTLARFTATLSAGMNHALVHEQERSGAAWMLEWLLLPQLLVATAAGLRLARALLHGVAELGCACKR